MSDVSLDNIIPEYGLVYIRYAGAAGNICMLRGPPLDYQGGEGAGVFVAGKLFISTGLGGALKISHFVTCLCGTVLEVGP